MSLKKRIRFKPLMDKATDPDTACLHIQDGTNVFISGFTAGYPKLIPQALVRRAKAGEQLKINLFAGASTGDQVAEAVIKRCAHPDYRDLLWDYYHRAIHTSGGHEPHLLKEAFDFHERFMVTGDMRPR